MQRYINGVGANQMAYSENNNMVYASSSRARVLDGSSLKKIEELSNVDSHSYVVVSPNEKYVAFLSESGHLRVFEIGHPHRIVLKKGWADYNSLKPSIKFLDNGSMILIPVNQHLYFINVHSGEEVVLHCPPESIVYSVDVFNDRVLICYGIDHDKSTDYFVSEYHNGIEETPITIQVDYGLHSACYTPNGQIMILTHDINNPMLIFDSIDSFDNPLQTSSISIPYYLRYSFSPDGKWFVYNILNDNGSQSAILVYTDDWSEVTMFDNIITASFSSKSNYLLLGARKPFIYQLNENI